MSLSIPPSTRSATFEKLFLWFSIAALVFGIIFLIAFGFAGIGRGDNYAKDFAYFYTAGQVWLAGGVPYLYEIFRETGLATAGLDPATNFAYLPTISLFATLMAMLPLGLAKIIMGVFNITAVSALCWVSLKIAFRDRPIEWFAPQSFLLCAIIIGNPFTAHVVWMGQTSLIVTAAISLAFIWAGQGRFILAGIMLSIASVKPQLTLLIGLWLLFEKHYKVFLVAIVVSLIACLPALITSGIIGLPFDWLTALQGYKGGVHDVVTFRHVFGLRSLLTNFGIFLPSLLPIALICFGILFWKRSLFDRSDILPLLIITSLTFIYAHDYDVAAFFIAGGSLWWFFRDKPLQGLIVLAMLAYICIPQRLVLHFIPDAGHYREPIFIILAGWLLWTMIKQSPGRLSKSDALESSASP